MICNNGECLYIGDVLRFHLSAIFQSGGSADTVKYVQMMKELKIPLKLEELCGIIT